MAELKLVAQALGLPLDSPIEKCVEAIGTLSKKATDGEQGWKEAEENLKKLERTDRILVENAKLRAEVFVGKAVADFQIDAAEANVLKGMFLRGEDGEKDVAALLATKKKGDYFTRKSSLVGSHVPTDPLAEIEGRAAELMAKDQKLSKSDAQTRVLNLDPDLAERYRTAIVKGAGGTD
jgi:hypothetical protein